MFNQHQRVGRKEDKPFNQTLLKTQISSKSKEEAQKALVAKQRLQISNLLRIIGQ